MAVPTEERKLEYKKAHAVGQLWQAIDDSAPPEEGVTRLPSTIAAEKAAAKKEREEKGWDEKLHRHRYKAGKKVKGISLGGRFTTAPPGAPADQQKGYHRKKRRP